MSPNAHDSRGYGADPDTNRPKSPWPTTLEAAERQLLSVLGDIILPEDAQSPAASTLDIVAFVDEWVSAPYPDQQADRELILSGLKWLDQQAARFQRASFLELSTEHRRALFDELASAARRPRSQHPQLRFFERLVFLFVGGYYTTEVGMRDLGYIGNVPLSHFPGPEAGLLRKVMLKSSAEGEPQA